MIEADVELSSDWEAWLLLRSDAHHDNAHCNIDLERQHLDQAIDRRAGILDIGDLFCAMQGKWDKRADRSQLRDEYHGGDYLNRLVDVATEFYTPYASNWLMMSHGNHETSVLGRHELDLTSQLVSRLNDRGNRIHKQTYQGYVQCRFRWGKRSSQTINIAYHHGYGGGGPVTKGVIQSNRQATFLADAHIVWMGHIHENWSLTLPRERLTAQGRLYLSDQLHIRTPGYKDEYSCGHGWHVGRGAPPKPVGAKWVRFYLRRSRDNGRSWEVCYEVRDSD